MGRAYPDSEGGVPPSLVQQDPSAELLCHLVWGLHGHRPARISQRYQLLGDLRVIGRKHSYLEVDALRQCGE